MCARFALHSDMEKIRARFRVRGKAHAAWAPRWNVTRGDEVPIIRRSEKGKREIALLKWGLELDYHLLDAADGPAIAIPARSLKRAALLQSLFLTQRCILPLDAFYVTPAYAGHARDWAFACAEDGILGVAAIWVPEPRGKHQGSFAIVETSPNESVALLSEAMPAMLFDEHERAWLGPATHPYDAYNLIKPYPADLMRAWPVARNAAETDGPGLLARVA